MMLIPAVRIMKMMMTGSSRTKRNKSDTILIELPRDIMNNPEVCTMLDRTGVSSRKAVGIISAILKAGKINGKEVDLSEFSL